MRRLLLEAKGNGACPLPPATHYKNKVSIDTFILFFYSQILLTTASMTETTIVHWQAHNLPVFSGKSGMISRDYFVCPVPSFSEMKEIG